MITTGTINPSAKAPSIDARYPSGKFNADTDYVKINFHDYVAPYSTQGATAAGNNAVANYASYNNTLGSPTSTLSLYMPEDIGSEYGASWQDTNISTIARGALGAFGKTAGGDPAAGLGMAVDALGIASNNFLTKGTGVVNAISQALQQANFGSLTVNEIFSVTTGQVLNPNTEVLYKGPKMRNFSLNFKMAPRNDAETKEIKNIIKAFKYATLPRIGGAGDQAASFIRVPQIVDVTFMKGSSPHPWITQYKPSVITSFDVSYTPDGAWATLPNGSPVATTIKISFQETKMVYADEVVGDGATY